MSKRFNIEDFLISPEPKENKDFKDKTIRELQQELTDSFQAFLEMATERATETLNSAKETSRDKIKDALKDVNKGVSVSKVKDNGYRSYSLSFYDLDEEDEEIKEDDIKAEPPKEDIKENTKEVETPKHEVYYVYLNNEGKVVTDKEPPNGYNIDSSKITKTHTSAEDFRDPLFSEVIKGKTFNEVIDLIEAELDKRFHIF